MRDNVFVRESAGRHRARMYNVITGGTTGQKSIIYNAHSFMSTPIFFVLDVRKKNTSKRTVTCCLCTWKTCLTFFVICYYHSYDKIIIVSVFQNHLKILLKQKQHKFQNPIMLTVARPFRGLRVNTYGWCARYTDDVNVIRVRFHCCTSPVGRPREVVSYTLLLLFMFIFCRRHTFSAVSLSQHRIVSGRLLTHVILTKITPPACVRGPIKRNPA